MIKRLFIVPIALALLGVSTIGVQAAVVSNQTLPITGGPPVTNPCTGELVTMNGDFHMLVGETASANGGYHLIFDDNFHYLGTSNTGSSYTAAGGNRYNADAVPPFPFVLAVTDTFNLISQGGAPNFRGMDVLHVTINADGRITVNSLKLSFICSP